MSASEQEVILTVNWQNSRNIYHTDPDCMALKRSKKTRRISTKKLFHDAEECKYCSGEHEPYRGEKQKPGGTCLSCDGQLNMDGECEFCSKFEDSMPDDLTDDRSWDPCASCGKIVWGPETDEDVYCEDCQ